MRSLLRGVASALVAAGLAACGGGSSSSVPGGTSSTGAGTLTPFSITVGPASSVTKVGIVSSAESGSPEHDITVAAGSSACTASGSSRTCTASLSLPTGPQTLTVTTYGTKTVKSTVQLSLSGSRVALAVSEPIEQISLNLATPMLAGSQAATTTLYVTARDANGNTIVGDFGGASIAITSSDTTGSVTISPSTVTAGGTAVTVSYNGSGSLATVSFNATASGVPASAIVAATLSFTASTLMYVVGNDDALVFPQGASGDVAPLQNIVVSSETFVNGAEPDGRGNLWLALGNQVNTLGEIGSRTLGYVPVSANGAVTPTYISPSAFPASSVVTDFGIDSAGNVYALVETLAAPPTVYVFPAGSLTPTRTFTDSAFSASTTRCIGIAVFGDGTTALTCRVSGTPQIPVFPAGSSGTVTPPRTITGASTGLTFASGYNYIQVGADGSLAVNDSDSSGNAAIDVFAPGANGNVAPARRIAGSATGLNSASLMVPNSSTGAHGLTWGVGIDATGATYAAQYGSQSFANGQVLRFAPTANGNVAPESVLGGPLTGFGAAYGPVHFSTGVAAVPTATSVTGDFLALAPNRGWNYAMTTPPEGINQSPVPPTTVSLYADPNPVDGATDLVVLAVPSGNPSTAIGAPGALISGEALFQQANDGGYVSPGYVPVSSGAVQGGVIPLPGNVRLVTGTLTVGQNIFAYPAGITGTVVSVGAVPGASACPGGATTGAIVTYVTLPSSETVGYVPGCGITYFKSDAGATAVLTSVGTYPSAGQLSSTRTPASVENIQALRALWKSVFLPWRP